MQERDPVFIDDAVKEVPSKAQAGAITVGMEVELGGGKFRIHSFGRKFLKLEALPGCVILKEKNGK